MDIFIKSKNVHFEKSESTFVFSFHKKKISNQSRTMQEPLQTWSHFYWKKNRDFLTSMNNEIKRVLEKGRFGHFCENACRDDFCRVYAFFLYTRCRTGHFFGHFYLSAQINQDFLGYGKDCYHKKLSKKRKIILAATELFYSIVF